MIRARWRARTQLARGPVQAQNRGMFTIEPIAFVRGAREAVEDDYWGGTSAIVELVDALDPACLDGIEAFSHAEILFVFDRVTPEKIVRGARHPRNDPRLPKAGIFAQRAKNRPNRIGSTIVRVLGREGRRLVVGELDAIEGTPVIDIKPVLRELLPRSPVEQPPWATEIMRDYWSAR